MPCANLEGLGTPLENSNLKTLRKITGDQITQINSNLKTLSKITGDRPRITLPRSAFECSRIYILQGVLKEILIIKS